jgi:hypothetical protein
MEFIETKTLYDGERRQRSIYWLGEGRMKAILKDGEGYKALEYNTSTVTLATKSGKPDIITWADVDHLVGDDGLERHREVVEGFPKIIVQAPKDPRWQPYAITPSQTDLFAAPSKCPQDDFEDAIALIDLIESDDERDAVRAVLNECFEGKARGRLRGMLSFEQKAKLQKAKS